MSKTPHPQSAEADFPPLQMERGPGGEEEVKNIAQQNKVIQQWHLQIEKMNNKIY